MALVYILKNNCYSKHIVIISLVLLSLLLVIVPVHAAQTPEITNPENGARYSSGDTPPILTWSEVTFADQYEIEFGLDSEFVNVFSLYSDTTELDFDVLLGDYWNSLSIQLYFHVRALASEAPISDWSEPVEFAKTLSMAPSVLTPVDDARFKTGDLLPVFQWEGLQGIDRYILQFASNETFENTMGSFEIAGSTLDCNSSGSSELWDAISGTFYWRVAGLENGIIPTPFSNAVVFSKTVDLPTTLLSPPDMTRFNGFASLPVFTWEPLTNISPEYHIQFAYDSAEFPPGGSYIPITGTSFTFESIGVTPEMWQQFYGKLEWRVAGIDSMGNHGAFSDAFSFVKLSNFNYMAYGDSITGGFGASDWNTGFAGYPRILEGLLQDRMGESVNVFCQQGWSWYPGGHAYTGNQNTNRAMEHHGPGTVMIMFGIIDIVDPGASGCEDNECHTIENLAGIINKVLQYQATPYIATLPPVNPISDRAFLQEEVDELNVNIRNMAVDLGVGICDLDTAFFSAPLPLEDYFNYDEENEIPDWAHFNDAGYQIIAESWNEIL